MMNRTAFAAQARQHDSLAQLRRQAKAWFIQAGLAGQGAGHPREVNLRAVQRFIDGDPHCTWNFENAGDFGFNDVLTMLASITGCSSDPRHETVDGYISPARTLEGLEEASARIAAVASGGGRVLMATGHPGALLTYYNGIGALIERWGGRIVRPARGASVPSGEAIDYVGSVGLITDHASLPHTHDHQPMEVLLAATGSLDLVIADHGYAGAAIEDGIPVVSMMDTNDPALAVWKFAGADVSIIPIDDNRPFNAYLPVVDLIAELGSRSQAG